MFQDKLFKNKFLLFKKKLKFSEYKFVVNTIIFNIKYNYLNYALTYYFVKSKITKSNINKFLSKLLMFLLIKKLFYQNTNKK